MRDWKYIKSNWKIFIHLLLRTKRLGVNNKIFEHFNSIFGIPLWKIIWRLVRVYPLIQEYRLIKYRAVSLHFLTDEECQKLGWKQDAIPASSKLEEKNNEKGQASSS